MVLNVRNTHVQAARNKSETAHEFTRKLAARSQRRKKRKRLSLSVSLLARFVRSRCRRAVAMTDRATSISPGTDERNTTVCLVTLTGR